MGSDFKLPPPPPGACNIDAPSVDITIPAEVSELYRIKNPGPIEEVEWSWTVCVDCGLRAITRVKIGQSVVPEMDRIRAHHRATEHS